MMTWVIGLKKKGIITDEQWNRFIKLRTYFKQERLFGLAPTFDYLYRVGDDKENLWEKHFYLQNLYLKKHYDKLSLD